MAESFASFEGSLHFDDDCFSLTSMSSADAVLKMLDECSSPSTPIHIGEVIDITDDSDEEDNSIGDDDDVQELFDPLFDIDNVAVQEWGQPAVSNECLDQIYTSISWEDIPIDNDGEAALSLNDDDVSMLMTGDIIEPTTMSWEVFEAEDLEPQHHYAASPGINATQLSPQQPQDLLPTPIACIMGYICETEQDRQVVLQAEEIVRDSLQQYQQGKRKYQQNLSGAIIERLLVLFGGRRFQKIYQGSQSFDPSDYLQQQRAPSTDGPSTLQLAVAYGMHMARLGHVEGSIDAVHSGADCFNSMKEKERQMFWVFMTQYQEG